VLEEVGVADGRTSAVGPTGIVVEVGRMRAGGLVFGATGGVEQAARTVNVTKITAEMRWMEFVFRQMRLADIIFFLPRFHV